MKSYVRCKNVDFESNRVESFYDLQLNIKSKANGKQVFFRSSCQCLLLLYFSFIFFFIVVFL